MSARPWRGSLVPAGVLTALLLLALALAGCSDTFVGPSGGSATLVPPPANTPAHLVELLRWAHENRSPSTYRTLFTSDYLFVFSAADSAGSAYRDAPWPRELEVLYGQNLFVDGYGSEPPATAITLEYGGVLTPVPDPRPGKHPRWHWMVPVEVVMSIRRPGADLQVTGTARFYVVRGDSAMIPADLGVAPDSTRWYVERWEDDTVASGIAAPGALAPQPASSTSWGRVKTLYVPPPPIR